VKAALGLTIEGGIYAIGKRSAFCRTALFLLRFIRG